MASLRTGFHTPTLVLAALLCCCHAYGEGQGSSAEGANPVRYEQIRRMINENRHLSAHMVRAVDARTIKEVRPHISDDDILVLAQMLGDRDYGVASAASALLATRGAKAVPVLLEAERSPNTMVSMHAEDALRRIDECSDDELRRQIDPVFCPADRPNRRR